MLKSRVAETDHGLTGESLTQMYDLMSRRLRDLGLMETGRIIGSGIDRGLVLEIGPGPDYSGLEWLKRAPEAKLQALEISADMIRIAMNNARQYGLESRVSYALGDAHLIPFADNTFDGAFSIYSLHEWADPGQVCDEIYRVLKPGASYCIYDIRRDVNELVKWLMLWLTRPSGIRSGLLASINAAYTVEEVHSLLRRTRLSRSMVLATPVGVSITGAKADQRAAHPLEAGFA